MKLALFGHGQMGRAVEAQARVAGHEIGAVLTSRNAGDAARLLPGHDAALDFSLAAAVPAHVAACAAAGVPLVLGTTGWQGEEAAVRRLVEELGATLVYAANFSIGIQVFYRLVAQAADLLGDAYDPFIEEAHHARKRDAPSGTALALRQILQRHLGGAGRDIPIASTRAGHIPGTHRVGFDAPGDQILLTHAARSRDGFAAGALLAARWATTTQRRGMHAFGDVLDEMLALDKERKDP